MRARLALALVIAVFLGVGGVAAAQGSSPTVEASPSSGLTAGQVISVTGSGYAPGQGVYVQLCAEPTGELRTTAGRADRCNPDQADDHTVWKTPVDPTGTFTVNLKVEPSFEGVDCNVEVCGVFTRRDHMGGADDFSQDAFGAVTFAAQATTAAPAAQAATATATVAAGTAGSAQLATTGISTTVAVVGLACLVLGMLLLGARRLARS